MKLETGDEGEVVNGDGIDESEEGEEHRFVGVSTGLDDGQVDSDDWLVCGLGKGELNERDEDDKDCVDWDEDVEDEDVGEKDDKDEQDKEEEEGEESEEADLSSGSIKLDEIFSTNGEELRMDDNRDKSEFFSFISKSLVLLRCLGKLGAVEKKEKENISLQLKEQLS